MFSEGSAKCVSIGIAISVVGVSLALLGCNSRNQSEMATTTKRTTSAAVNSPPADVDLNCVMDHFRNPSESFHYTFTDQSDNPWSEEADVTPQVIDVSFMNNSLPKPQTLHATPQEIPHQYQWGIGRMASLFALVHSIEVNQGTQTVNGYSTTKLSINTTSADATEQGFYRSTFGPGGWAKGTVWVTSQGCPVQMQLDEELHSKDGTVSGKAHYAEAMVKK
jgi:hypothetical protein